MHRGILVVALVALAALVAASPAAAAGHRSHSRHRRRPQERYSPAHSAKCRKHYRRVVKRWRRHGRRHRKVFCVRRHASSAVELHAHLDPTFTRHPLDPFKVTYAYSASATKRATAASAEKPAPLPSGVLSLFSDGKLECAVFVGAGVKGSKCTVDYAALGRHRVKAIYTSGQRSAAETRLERIPRLKVAAGEFETAVVGTVKPVEGAVEVEANRPALVEVVTTSYFGQDPPPIEATLDCEGDVAPESLSPSGCYQATDFTEYVYARSKHPCSVGVEGVFISSKTQPALVKGFEFSPAEIESGANHLRVTIPAGGGYAASEATVPIQFKLPSLC